MSQQEKVEYFGNKDIVVILLTCFGIGIFIGVSFANYKNSRFNLIKEKIAKVRNEEARIKSDLISFETKDLLKTVEDIRELKGRTFDSGCTTTNGVYKFNQTYEAKPTLMFTMNGFLLNNTAANGLWEQGLEYTYTNKELDLTKISPEGQEIHVCWLVVPNIEEPKKKEQSIVKSQLSTSQEKGTTLVDIEPTLIKMGL